LILIKNIFYVIFAFGLIFILFYYLKNKEKFNNINIEKFKEKIFKYKNKEKKQDYSKNEIVKIVKIKDKNTIDEEKKVTEEIYPSKYDKKFIYKLEDIFRTKLKEKYKIEDIKNKTYIDIL